ncbi:MAG TPA: LptF/LptG family permease [Limnochordales bacterium]
MRILDRYILRELGAPFLFGVLAFTSLFLSVDLVQLVRMAVDYNAPLGVALRLVALRLPQVIVYTFPMAVLLAGLLTLGRLSANSEVVAMQAGTVSLYRIVAPVIGVGFTFFLLTLAVNEWVVPQTNYAYRRVLVEELQGRQLPVVTRNVILREYQAGLLRSFLYAQEYDGQARVMRGVTVVELAEGRPVRTTYARRVVWERDSWWMEDGVIHIHDGEPAVTVDFREGRQPIAVGYRPEQVVAAQKKIEEMTIRELREHISVMGAHGSDLREYLLQLHMRFSLPAASFVFALLAAPLGVRSHRSASSAGFGLSMVVILVYYVLMTLGTALAQGGHVHPAVGAWLPSAVPGAAGVALLIRAGRR